MKELYFFDETFYWKRSGKRATVIEAECELTYSVRPDTAYTDRGRHDFDSFPLGSVPCKAKIQET